MLHIMKYVSLLCLILSLLGCNNKSTSSKNNNNNSYLIENIETDDNQHHCCDLYFSENPHSEFLKNWVVDRGNTFLKIDDLSYQEALAYAAYVDLNVRTEGIGAWATGLGELPPDDGSRGEYPEGARLIRLTDMRIQAFEKLGVLHLNKYFEEWSRLQLLFESNPNKAFDEEKKIEQEYSVVSCNLLHKLYVTAP